jgi:hypothetical protein
MSMTSHKNFKENALLPRGEGDLTLEGIDLQASKQFLECKLDFAEASLSIDILHGTSC